MTSRSHHEPGPTVDPTPDTVTAALWGWARLLTGTAAQVYLVLLITLAVFVPRGPGGDDGGEGADDDTQELPVLARGGALTVAGTAVLAGLTA